MENLEEQIKLLVELQGLDTHILRMENDLEAIPEAIKRMDEDFKAEADTLKALENGVKALQLKRKEKEGDLEGKEGNIKKYQTVRKVKIREVWEVLLLPGRLLIIVL